MTPATDIASTHVTTRPPKPRAYVVPIVRPLPPRPSGIGSDDTW